MDQGDYTVLCIWQLWSVMLVGMALEIINVTETKIIKER